MKEKQKNIIKYRLDKNNPPLLSEEEAQSLDELQDKDIDYSEIPDLSKNTEFWATVELTVPKRKKQITLRLDEDVIKWFKIQGKGYQTKINSVLKTYMKVHSSNPSANE